MSETIQVALITLVSGFLGTALGAFTTCWTVKKNAEQERRNRLFAEKQSAYAAFLDAFFALSSQITTSKGPHTPDNGEESAKITRLSVSYAKARLFAPPMVAAPMKACVDSVFAQGRTRRVPADAGDQFESLVSAMKADLNKTLPSDLIRD